MAESKEFLNKMQALSEAGKVIKDSEANLKEARNKSKDKDYANKLTKPKTMYGKLFKAGGKAADWVESKKIRVSNLKK